MVRKSFPSENELVTMYQGVLERFGNKPVTMRTLDIGGDKSLPYFPIEEENPFLGWRGIRITLDHPEIFLVQFRAMLRANANTGNLKIMLPMISSIDEIDESIRLFEQACLEIAEELQQDIPIPALGVMVEVPSIVYLIDKLADKVAFCSVGSNDLTQYLLAVDRNNSRVSTLYDSYHPAVLHALHDIMQRTTTAKIPTSICGELAGDPGGALLLQGLGYRELSLNGSLFAKIKWLIRRVSIEECQQLANECMAQHTAAAVRNCVEAFLKRKDLWSVSQTAHSDARSA
jgi:phosphotransferase system enzyme I (PtsP)